MNSAGSTGDLEITDEVTTSQLSGRTNEELAAAGEVRKDHAARAKVAKARKAFLPIISKLSGARTGLLPVFLEPSLASQCEKPPTGPKWIHEIKYDGYRMQARIDERKIRLLTRKKLDWTERFLSIADALKAFGLGSALIDGEIVVEDASGISSFNDLQADLKAGRLDRFRYFVFDVLYCEGFDLTKAVLKDRKNLLQQLLAILPPGSPIRFSEHLDVDGPTMLEHACRFGLEGIVSKRADLPYRSGRGDHWLKSKCLERQEFIILGYIPSTAASRSVGSLALGYHDNQSLAYAGRVGTGWSQEQARMLRDELEAIRANKPSFAKSLPAGTEKGVRWVEPRLICEIEYRGWTGDRLLRMAAFKGLRDDKSAEEIVLEAPLKRSRPRALPDREGIRLTHPEKILWEEAGITKQGLADFYADIADWILPHVAGRPLSLLRCPSGTAAKCFFAKHPWQGLDKSVRRVNTGDKEPMLAIDDVTGLISLAQAGVVEIHPWAQPLITWSSQIVWSLILIPARMSRGRSSSTRLVTCVTGSQLLACRASLRLQVGRDFTLLRLFNRQPTGTKSRCLRKRSRGQWPRTGQTVMSLRLRKVPDTLEFLLIICATTAVPPRLPLIRRVHCRGHRFRYPQLGGTFTRTRSNHFTVGNVLHRLSSLKRDPWQGFFKIRQRLPQFQHVTRRQRASS